MSSEFIPDTAKQEIIPQDLKDQWGAAQACSVTLALFDQAYFSPRHVDHIRPSMAFLAKLHEQTVEVALKHPQAHMIPELKELLKQKTAPKAAKVLKKSKGKAAPEPIQTCEFEGAD